MTRHLDPRSPLNAEFLSAIGETISRFLETRAPLLEAVGTNPMLPIAQEATAGGKRLRPAYCYWSYVAAAGQPIDDSSLLAVAASLDLLHVSALVHDDLIDSADTRRGLPAAHKRFEALHTSRGGRGAAAEFGTSAAILLGDLLLMWSIELADASGAELLELARPLLHLMRAEVTLGQFLDVSAQYAMAGAQSVSAELDVARRVLEYKTASYSIRRPAQIGAALGGANAQLHDALGTFGSAIGSSFQLRDDVLGVYGDPAVTGKPYGGDIHEGKRTVLVLTALAQGDEAIAAELSELLGADGLSDSDVFHAGELIESSGALASVEELIARGYTDGLSALEAAPMTQEGRTALTQLAELSVRRAR